MYCRECGNKLLTSDKFCSNCGTKIIKNISNANPDNKNASNNSNQKNNNELPMNWYKFFTYFRLPVGIVLNIFSLFFYNYSSFVYNKLALGIFFINVGLIVLFIISFYMLHKKIKNTMTYIIILLIVECFSMMIDAGNSSADILTYIVAFLMAFWIWFVPNYIYFKKRKNVFVNKF